MLPHQSWLKSDELSWVLYSSVLVWHKMAFKTSTYDSILWTWYWAFRLHKRQRLPWLAEHVLPSQEWLCITDLLSMQQLLHHKHNSTAVQLKTANITDQVLKIINIKHIIQQCNRFSDLWTTEYRTKNSFSKFTERRLHYNSILACADLPFLTDCLQYNKHIFSLPT
jgi:hypothetical protein